MPPKLNVSRIYGLVNAVEYAERMRHKWNLPYPEAVYFQLNTPHLQRSRWETGVRWGCRLASDSMILTLMTQLKEEQFSTKQEEFSTKAAARDRLLILVGDALAVSSRMQHLFWPLCWKREPRSTTA